MKQYRTTTRVVVDVFAEIEAESPEEARKRARYLAEESVRVLPATDEVVGAEWEADSPTVGEVEA